MQTRIKLSGHGPRVAPALVAGTAAALLSAAVRTRRGEVELGAPAAPINATTQWLYGEQALRADRPSLRHTLIGALTHWASSLLWASMFEYIVRRDGPPSAARIVAGAAGVAATAAVVDFKVVPARFSPGFEHRVSKPSLTATYVAFAGGLALAGWILRRR